VSGEPKTLATSRIYLKKVLITMGILALIAISITTWTAVVRYQAKRVATTTAQSFDLVTLARKARDAVVLIEAFDSGGNEIAGGSGFFISADGLLVTNYHVIKRGSSAVAKTTSGQLLPIIGATVVDRENDIAVLAVDGGKLPFLTFENTGTVQVGSHIAIIGSPFGLEGSLSEGIVSAKRAEVDGERHWLQITAPISPGSSGSPVLDSDGKVIGVAAMELRGGQSLNFAIPSEVVVAMQPQQQQQIGHPVALQELATHDAYEFLVSESSDYKTAYSAMISALGEQGDWATALASAKTLAVTYPSCSAALELLGKSSEKMGLIEEATEAYQRAIKLSPDNPHLWASLASIYKNKALPSQAAFAFSQAIAHQQKWVEKQASGSDKSISLAELGDMYHSAGDDQAAKQSYIQAIQQDPRMPMSFYPLMEIYLSEGNEKAAFDVAYQGWLRAPNRKIPEAQAWDTLAVWYHDHGRDADEHRCSGKARILGFQPSEP